MRVCYVLPMYDEGTGEHYRYLYDILDRLSARVDLRVVVEKAAGPVRRAWPRVRVLRARNPLARALELLWVLVGARLEGCERFYVHYSYYGGVLAGAVALATGGRAYYWNCGLAGKYLTPWGRRGALRAKLRNDWPLLLSLRLATRLVTGTPRMARYYEETFGVPSSRSRVVPNWVDGPIAPTSRLEARAALDVSGDASVVLFLHHLSRRKGVHRLPELSRELARRAPGMVFLVAGDGPDGAWLAAQGAPLRLLGRVPNRDVSLLYRAADVLVVPSEEEGFPRVLLEAMSHGVPFVATDVGGVRDVVPGSLSASVVADGDMTAFADRVVAILRDPRLRELHAGAWEEVRSRFCRSAAVEAWLRALE